MSSGKIDKYEYLTSEEILPSDQNRIIKLAKFTYSSFGKALEKQIKIIEDRGRKQVKSLKVLKSGEIQQDLKSIEGLSPKEMRTNEIKNEFDEIAGWEDKIKTNNLKYETSKGIYDFQQIKMIRPFGESIIDGKITISEADKDQSNLLENIVEFNNKSRPKTKKDSMQKETLLIV